MFRKMEDHVYYSFKLVSMSGENLKARPGTNGQAEADIIKASSLTELLSQVKINDSFV